jgi:hypothetical protein
MSRKNRLATMAEAKAEGMSRKDRKASGRSLKTLSPEELKELAAKGRGKVKGKGLANAAREALLRSDDWQAVGQRKRDLIEGQKRFNESEAAALLTTRPYRKSDERFSEYISDKYRL